VKKRTCPYNTRCRKCGKPIAKGDWVWFGKHDGARCLDCGGEPGEAKPDRAPAAEAPAPKSAPARPVGCPPVSRDSDGVYRFQWDSVGDAVADAFADRAQSEESRADLARRIQDAEGGKWANHHTKESMRKAVGNPRPASLKAIDEMREALADELVTPVVPRRRVRHGREDGDELDPDRWLIREPMAWGRSEREPRNRLTVTIGLNLSVHAFQKPDELLFRGAAACALADLLTVRGLNVAIVGFLAVSDMSRQCGKIVSKVELKSSEMPLDLGAIATAACDIGFLRLVMAYGTARHALGKLDECLGRPISLPPADRNGLDYVIDNDVTSQEAALKWLKSVAGPGARAAQEGGAE